MLFGFAVYSQNVELQLLSIANIALFSIYFLAQE